MQKKMSKGASEFLEMLKLEQEFYGADSGLGTADVMVMTGWSRGHVVNKARELEVLGLINIERVQYRSDTRIKLWYTIRMV